MKSLGKVVYVSRKGFSLSDGRHFDHPWELTEQWTIRQMQAVYEHCWQSFEIQHAENEIEKHKTDVVAPVWTEGMTRQDYEKELIINVLHDSHWIQKEAAKRLKINTTTLNEKIKRFGIRYGGWRVHKPGKNNEGELWNKQ